MKSHVYRYASSASLFTALAMAALTSAQAQGPSAIIQSQGVAITAADLESELSRAPAEVRAGLLQKQDALAQVATNLLMRRALAKQAEEAGLPKLPANETALRLAKDRVLSDARLQQLDKQHALPDAALEERALSIYKAESQRYQIPEEVHARHILIRTAEGAKQKAEEILAELKKGADFEALAKEKSEDPGSAPKGGDLGSFGRGKMVKVFEDTAFALKNKGDLSEVVESQFGFHILQLVSRQEAGRKPFSEVREELRNEANNKYLNEMRQKEGQKILQGAKTSPEALEAFIASQSAK